jgi:translation initiation factor eIF-2B subunit beta
VHCNEIMLSDSDVTCVCALQISHPAFDYVPPDLVSLYVTNDGNQLPSYVFRQLSEYYHPQDYYIL